MANSRIIGILLAAVFSFEALAFDQSCNALDGDSDQCFLGEVCRSGRCEKTNPAKVESETNTLVYTALKANLAAGPSFSSIAVSPSSGKGSVSYCQKNKRRATLEAIRGCSATGAADCSTIVSVEDGFVAIAAYESAPYAKLRFAGAAATTRAGAIRSALTKCGDMRCQIYEISDNCAFSFTKPETGNAGAGWQTLPGKPILNRREFN